MDIEKERTVAEERVQLFVGRYREVADGFPVVIAKEWRNLLRDPELDLTTMKAIVEKATQKKNHFDISFFGLCNHLESCLRDPLGGNASGIVP